MKSLVDVFVKYLAELDCLDEQCLFARTPLKGGTKGGCKCLSDVPPDARDLLIKLHDFYYPNLRPQTGRYEPDAADLADKAVISILLTKGWSSGMIPAIKEYRHRTGLGLAESKNRVDYLRDLLRSKGQI